MKNNYKSHLFYALQIYGDLELARGDTTKAILYYKRGLKQTKLRNINHKTMYLHKKISDCLINNKLTINEAKYHLKKYNVINDSLISHNKMVADLILSDIIKETDNAYSEKKSIFISALIGLILISLSIGTFLSLKNIRNHKKLESKNKILKSKKEQISLLEEELGNSKFQNIIELAKSNSPEFLPLFRQEYPEFVEAMKKINPNIRSSELYFCALAYLNFSTKDIANFTFVTNRAVQLRKNRLRKKYSISSEVDFNEWFRNLTK